MICGWFLLFLFCLVFCLLFFFRLASPFLFLDTDLKTRISFKFCLCKCNLIEDTFKRFRLQYEQYKLKTKRQGIWGRNQILKKNLCSNIQLWGKDGLRSANLSSGMRYRNRSSPGLFDSTMYGCKKPGIWERSWNLQMLSVSS